MFARNGGYASDLPTVQMAGEMTPFRNALTSLSPKQSQYLAKSDDMGGAIQAWKNRNPLNPSQLVRNVPRVASKFAGGPLSVGAMIAAMVAGKKLNQPEAQREDEAARAMALQRVAQERVPQVRGRQAGMGFEVPRERRNIPPYGAEMFDPQQALLTYGKAQGGIAGLPTVRMAGGNEDLKAQLLRQDVNAPEAVALRGRTGPEIIPEFHPRYGYPVLNRRGAQERQQKYLDEKYGPTVSVRDLLKGRHHKAGQEIQIPGGTILRQGGGIAGLPTVRMAGEEEERRSLIGSMIHDRPAGAPPLSWMAAEAMRRYGGGEDDPNPYMPVEGGGKEPPMREWSEVSKSNLESAERTYSDYVDSLPYANTPGNQAANAHEQFVLNDKKAQELRADIEYWREQNASAPATVKKQCGGVAGEPVDITATGVMQGATPEAQADLAERGMVMPTPEQPQNAEENAIYNRALLALQGQLENEEAQMAVDEFVEVFGADALAQLEALVNETRDKGGIVKPANGQDTVGMSEMDVRLENQGPDVIPGMIVDPQTGKQTANLRVGEDEYIMPADGLEREAKSAGLPPTAKNGAMVVSEREEQLRRAYG